VGRKVLGVGAEGTVFKATDAGGRKYSYKIEKIMPRDRTVNYRVGSPWRAINFTNKVCRKYPRHFTKLYGYRVEDDCKHARVQHGAL